MTRPSWIGTSSRTEVGGAVAALASLVAACSGQVDSDWRLVGIEGMNAAAPPEVQARIGAGVLSGSDGCNRFTATLAGSRDSGVVRDFQTTLIACQDPLVNAHASRISAVLGGSPRYQRREDRLEISGSQGRLVFHPADRQAVN